MTRHRGQMWAGDRQEQKPSEGQETKRVFDPDEYGRETISRESGGTEASERSRNCVLVA